MKIYLAKHRGFCSGVKRSLRLAQKTLAEISGPVYILNEIVHNKTVIEDIEKQGLKRVSKPAEANEGALLISAHGVPRDVIHEAMTLNLNLIDTTCPLVRKIHKAAEDLIEQGYDVILFGDPEHDEVKGIRSVDPDRIHVLKSIDSIETLPDFDRPVAFISQSTCSGDEFNIAAGKLQMKYKSLSINNTICRATHLRQESIHRLAGVVDLVVVMGSQTSANSKHLMEIVKSYGKKAFLIDNANELNVRWLDGIENLGITSGASTPEHLVDELMQRLTDYAQKSGITTEILEI